VPNIPFDGTLSGWRAAARALLAAGVAPAAVAWESAADAQTALALGPDGGEFGASGSRGGVPPAPPPTVRVPRRFLALAALVACHRDPGRWGALYHVLWRLTAGGEPHLLAVSVDPDVLRLTHMAKAVRREVHKMHAFVRFRAVAPGAVGPAGGDADAGEFVAWFEPEHDVVARAAPFFVRRFPNMRWAILTPRGTARWDGRALVLGPGVPAGQAPGDDSLEALWGVYYAHVFNPARLKLAAMRSEMPKRYWRHLPEARLIDGMVREAPARMRRMVEVAGGEQVGVRRAVGPRTGGADVMGRTWSDGDVTAAREGARTVEPGEGAASAPVRIGAGTQACEVRVGTVGWGDVAPEDGVAADARPPEARLRDYAARFPLVEVDGTCRALPTPTVAALWGARTPAGFVVDVRAHAALTGHPVEPRRLPRRVRDLLPPSLAGVTRILAGELPARVREAIWADFLGALQPLADAGKLGAVHLRLPRWATPSRAVADALAAARDALGGQLAAVEFRHRDWFAPRVRARTLALLERLAFAHTVVDAPAGFVSAVPLVAEVTHPTLAVVRLHGRRSDTWEGAPGAKGERYRYRYAPAELAELVPAVVAVAERATRVHVLFSSGHAACGAANARELAEALRECGSARGG